MSGQWVAVDGPRQLPSSFHLHWFKDDPDGRYWHLAWLDSGGEGWSEEYAELGDALERIEDVGFNWMRGE